MDFEWFRTKCFGLRSVLAPLFEGRALTTPLRIESPRQIVHIQPANPEYFFSDLAQSDPVEYRRAAEAQTFLSAIVGAAVATVRHWSAGLRSRADRYRWFAKRSLGDPVCDPTLLRFRSIAQAN